MQLGQNVAKIEGLKKLWVQNIVGENQMLGARILGHKQTWILKQFVVQIAFLGGKMGSITL